MRKKIRRRVLSAALLVLVALITGGAFFGWRWLESEVDRQVRSRVATLAARIGARATVGAVDLAPDGTARIRNVVLTRGPSTLRIYDVRVVVDPVEALRRPGLGAVTSVLVDGVRWREAGDPDARALFERLREIVRAARQGSGGTRISVSPPRLALPKIRIRDVVLSTEGRTFVAARAEARTDDDGRLVWDASGTVDVEPGGPIGFGPSAAPRLALRTAGSSSSWTGRWWCGGPGTFGSRGSIDSSGPAGGFGPGPRSSSAPGASRRASSPSSSGSTITSPPSSTAPPGPSLTGAASPATPCASTTKPAASSCPRSP